MFRAQEEKEEEQKYRNHVIKCQQQQAEIKGINLHLSHFSPPSFSTDASLSASPSRSKRCFPSQQGSGVSLCPADRATSQNTVASTHFHTTIPPERRGCLGLPLHSPPSPTEWPLMHRCLSQPREKGTGSALKSLPRLTTIVGCYFSHGFFRPKALRTPLPNAVPSRAL